MMLIWLTSFRFCFFSPFLSNAIFRKNNSIRLVSSVFTLTIRRHLSVFFFSRYIEGNMFKQGTKPIGTHIVLEVSDSDFVVWRGRRDTRRFQENNVSELPRDGSTLAFFITLFCMVLNSWSFLLQMEESLDYKFFFIFILYSYYDIYY